MRLSMAMECNGAPRGLAPTTFDSLSTVSAVTGNAVRPNLQPFAGKRALPEEWGACTMNTGRLFYLEQSSSSCSLLFEEMIEIDSFALKDKNENLIVVNYGSEPVNSGKPSSNHAAQTSHWAPPTTCWSCPYGLPYGWEMAVDTTGKSYYVNHVHQITTYSDPRSDEDYDIPQTRDVHIVRDQLMGYGFVAGSEKPVIVRFVTEGGPSDQKLFPGDEILAVNHEDVSEAEKDHVVRLVRKCPNEVMLTVCQPRTSDCSLKSAILSASKRARLRHTPSRVRFAEGVTVGTPPDTPSGSESCVPLMPNVLRVFLENGQTRSFKYDHTTTVNNVISSLCEKLGLRRKEYFALLLEHPQGPRSNKLTVLRKDEKLLRIAARPGSQHFRCLFRVAFIPTDPMDLQRTDNIAFEYYYQQCVNDVVAGRFAYDMRYEACLRLAALQMQQVALDTHMTSNAKISLKAMEKEYGLTVFLPVVLLENVKKKEIRKHLRYYLKRDYNKLVTTSNMSTSSGPNNNNNLTGLHSDPCSTTSFGSANNSPASNMKLKYVHMLSHLPNFGGRIFYVTFRPSLSMHFEMIGGLIVCPQNELVKQLTLQLADDPTQELDFFIDKDDIDDMVELIRGYYAVATGGSLEAHWEEQFDSEAPVPPYYGFHSVRAAGWNYAHTSVNNSMNARRSVSDAAPREHLVDLSKGPPRYHEMMKHIPIKRPPVPMLSNPRNRRSSHEAHRENRPTNLSKEQDTYKQRSRSVCVEVHPEPLTAENPQLPKFTVGPQKSDSSTTTTESESVSISLNTSSKTADTEMTESETLRVTTDGEDNKEEDTPEDVDKCIAVIASQLQNKVLNKRESEDYVRHTFLSAKDSLLIKNKPASMQPRRKESELSVEEETQSEMEELETCIESGGDTDRKESSVSGPDLSSSDTESCLSTPSESPIHRPIATRPAFLKALCSPSAGAKNHSFGLQSPDSLPCSLLTETEMHELIASCGLEGQQLEDLLLLFPDNFCTDTEITDLTLFPLPETPDELPNFDLAAAAVRKINPPTPFRDVDPGQEFSNLMDRLAEGDVGVIEDSHHKATKSCQLVKANKKESLSNTRSLRNHNSSAENTSNPLTGDQWKNRLVLSEFLEFPSISNRLAFEQFLAQSIIPPPPPSFLDKSKELLNRKQQELFNRKHSVPNKFEKRVRFSSEAIVRRRSASGGLERLLATERVKDHCSIGKIVPLSCGTTIGRLVESQTFPIDPDKYPETIITSGELLSQETIQLSESPPKEEKTDIVQHVGKGENPTQETSMADDFLNLPKQEGKEVRRTTLHDFSGLESTDFCPPTITKVDLKHFDGLQGLDRGVASLEVKEETVGSKTIKTDSCEGKERRGSQGTPGKVRRFFARIRSVDIHTFGSPEASPKKLPSPKIPVSPPPMKAIKEKILLSEPSQEQDEILEVPDHIQHVDVQKVSLSAYSGLEMSPKRSLQLQHGSPAHESLLNTFSAARRRSLPKSGASDTQSDAAARDDSNMRMGNGFLNTETTSKQTSHGATDQDFKTAIKEVEEAIQSLEAYINHLPARSPKRRADGQGSSIKQQLKIQLLTESQQLAAASKLLVRSTTEPLCPVVSCLERSVNKANTMGITAQQLIKDCGCSLFQAQTLGAKVREVLKALTLTIGAVQDARGKNLGDPEMKKLMLQSTSLAATLTQLIHCVRENVL